MSQILTPTPKTEFIDGLEFRVIPFDAWEALGLLTRLIKTVGPALSSFSDLDPNTDVSEIGPVITSGFAALSPSEAQSLALELLKQTSVILEDGRRVEITNPQKFSQVFNGRLKTMFKVIGFSAKVNFASFSDGGVSEPSAQ